MSNQSIQMIDEEPLSPDTPPQSPPLAPLGAPMPDQHAQPIGVPSAAAAHGAHAGYVYDVGHLASCLKFLEVVTCNTERYTAHMHTLFALACSLVLC